MTALACALAAAGGGSSSNGAGVTEREAIVAAAKRKESKAAAAAAAAARDEKGKRDSLKLPEGQWCKDNTCQLAHKTDERCRRHPATKVSELPERLRTNFRALDRYNIDKTKNADDPKRGGSRGELVLYPTGGQSKLPAKSVTIAELSVFAQDAAP